MTQMRMLGTEVRLIVTLTLLVVWCVRSGGQEATGTAPMQMESGAVETPSTSPLQFRAVSSRADLDPQPQPTKPQIQLQAEPQPPGAQLIDARQTTEMALEGNLTLNVKRLDPALAQTQVSVERAAFDPVFYWNLTASRQRTPTTIVDFDDFTNPDRQVKGMVTQEDGTGVRGGPGVGFSQKLPTGMEINAEFSATRTTEESVLASFPTSYNTAMYFRVTQPLLRGAGADANLTNLAIARNNCLVSEAQLREQLLNSLAEAQQVYWELVYSVSDVAIKRQSLALAADFLRQELIKEEHGAAVPVDVKQAEAEVARREQDLIVALTTIGDNQDHLRNVLNLDTGPGGNWQDPLWPADHARFTGWTSDPETAIELAFHYDPLRFQYCKWIENARLDLGLAHDNLQPALDLIASGGWRGLGKDFSSSLSGMGSLSYYDWMVGVQFEVPVLLRAERAGVRRAQLAVAQAILEAQDYDNSLIVDARRAVRQVDSKAKQVAAAREGRIASQAAMNAGQEAFNAGAMTAHDLLDLQNRYAESQTNEERAIIDHVQAVIELHRVQGTLLFDLGVDVTAEYQD